MMRKELIQKAASEAGFTLSKRKNVWFVVKDRKKHWQPLRTEQEAWGFGFSWMCANLEVFYDPSTEELVMLCPRTPVGVGLIAWADLSGTRETGVLSVGEFQKGGRFKKVICGEAEGPWGRRS